MGFLCIYIYERPKVDMIVLGNPPKSTQQNRRNKCPKIVTVFYFFITSKSTLFYRKKKCIKLGVLICNSTVYIEILACIKTFVKATTSNTSKLRADFLYGTI